jgi:hypothetical protein
MAMGEGEETCRSSKPSFQNLKNKVQGDPFRISESTLYQTITCLILSDFLDLLRVWIHQVRAFTTSLFSDLFQLIIVRIVLECAKSAKYMVRKSWGLITAISTENVGGKGGDLICG